MTVKCLTEPVFCNRLMAGDERAFRELFDQYHRKIYQFAFNFLKDKEQSEEIVQHTFLNFWLSRSTIDPDRPIAPYLFTIARRILTDAWRKAAASSRFREHVIQHMESVSNETEERIFFDELEDITRDALTRLSEQQHQVFTLSRQEGLSYEEIAERLHMSKHTVKYHLVNALKILKAHFHKHDIIFFLLLFFR